MVELVPNPVSDRPKFLESLNGGGFGFHSVERTNRGVQIPLGLVEFGTEPARIGFSGCPSFHASGFGLDFFDDSLFEDFGTDCHMSFAVTGGWASVNPVVAVAGGNDHATVTCSASGNTEPGEEPGGGGSWSSGNDCFLDSSEQARVDEGFVGGRVEQFSELDFSKVDAGAEHAAGSVVAANDPFGLKKRADLLNGFSRLPHPECFPDCFRVVGNDFENTCITGPVAGRDSGEWRGPSGDGLDLCGGDAFRDLAALIFGHESTKRSVKPFAVGGVTDLAHVEREDSAPGAFDPISDLMEDVEVTYEPVKVRDDENTDLASFNGFNGGGEPGAVNDLGGTGHIEFFMDAVKFDALGVTPFCDAVGLIFGGDEAVAFPAFYSGNTNDAGGSDHYVSFILAYLRWVVSHVTAPSSVFSVYERSC